MIIVLPLKKITNKIYEASITWLCAMSSLNRVDLSDVNQIIILNSFAKQGLVFEGGKKQYEEISNVPINQAIVLLVGNTRFFANSNHPIVQDDIGQWQVNTESDLIDDSTTVHILIEYESDSRLWRAPIRLYLRCRNNKTDVIITWQDFLGLDRVSVATRIGESKAVEESWVVSTNGTSSFHPRPIKFIKEMIGNKRLVARTTPYSSNTKTVVFNIHGLGNAIKPLREACNW